ncbi:hypothetical protein GCM10009730_09520 [Streptomyces albidochromogenes]
MAAVGLISLVAVMAPPILTRFPAGPDEARDTGTQGTGDTGHRDAGARRPAEGGRPPPSPQSCVLSMTTDRTGGAPAVTLSDRQVPYPGDRQG